MTTQWQHQPERSTAFWLKLIRWGALHLGRGFTRLLLYPIVGYFLLAAPRTKRESRKFLTRALGRPATFADTCRHLHCFASTILDRVFLLSDRYQQLDVQVHNREAADALARSGQGCLLVGSHLGSFEVLRTLGMTEGAKANVKIKMLMRHQQSQTITRLLEALNPDILAHMIDSSGSSTNTALQIGAAVADGYQVSLMGDRVNSADEAVARCEFLGHSAELPVGWVKLAAVLKVPVLLCHGIYRGGNRYDVYFELFAQRIELARSQRDQQAAEWVRRYASRLEYYARNAPYNWFNFYDFWGNCEG